MRLAHTGAQLALLASTAHAFYPFTPKWLRQLDTAQGLISRKSDLVEEDARSKNEPGTQSLDRSRVVREATRMSKRYGRSRTREADDEFLSKRDNKYNVMEAVDTDEDLATGVNQDGNDYSYFIKVKLGSDSKELYMLIDTGAGSSWVMGPDCDTEACTMHDSFGADDSTTFEDTGDNFTINYGTGQVKGTLAKDTISVAGMSFEYDFGVASSTSSDFVSFAFDGILGLSMTDAANQNFLEAVAESGDVDANIFSVALARAADGENTGEIKFGGINDAKYEGDIAYTELSSEDGDWAIEIEDVKYDGSKSGAGGVDAYIDTGTTFIFGPKDLVKKVHSVVPDATSSDGMFYTVPCDSGPLTFTFSGKDIEISTKDWISPKGSDGSCTSNIYGQEVVKGSWLLGATFIKNVYAVFDKDKKRIGFAQHVEDSSATPTSTKGSSSTVTPSATYTGGANDTAPTLGLGGQETTGAPDAEATDSDSDSASSVLNFVNSKGVFVACWTILAALLA
ncbi:hypothetical protein N3K66_003161 [Trichothecium roseum]|uniref:Uncharacterized protein n=1 Tax=Trichothecium roseum TaxID=47278 RepID=A0ACC0V4H9_9HYPO|nr:hypothetical protein N3K66_003161 [Trichothecium roseum]